MIAMIGTKRPGITWRRGTCCWEGWNGRSYVWVRSPWRIATVWLATAAVFALIAYGVCQ